MEHNHLQKLHVDWTVPIPWIVSAFIFGAMQVGVFVYWVANVDANQRRIEIKVENIQNEVTTLKSDDIAQIKTTLGARNVYIDRLLQLEATVAGLSHAIDRLNDHLDKIESDNRRPTTR